MRRDGGQDIQACDFQFEVITVVRLHRRCDLDLDVVPIGRRHQAGEAGFGWRRVPRLAM